VTLGAQLSFILTEGGNGRKNHGLENTKPQQGTGKRISRR
jgi:hypothetical protein